MGELRDAIDKVSRVPYRTISLFSVMLGAIISSCASDAGMRERANDNLAQCLKAGQPRTEVIECLQLAHFPPNNTYSDARGISAHRCAPLSQLVILPACASFSATFDTTDKLATWNVTGYYDGP